MEVQIYSVKAKIQAGNMSPDFYSGTFIYSHFPPKIQFH